MKSSNAFEADQIQLKQSTMGGDLQLRTRWLLFPGGERIMAQVFANHTDQCLWSANSVAFVVKRTTHSTSKNDDHCHCWKLDVDAH
jgi:hypothetical protein